MMRINSEIFVTYAIFLENLMSNAIKWLLTETPFLGPRNEISSSLCNHMTVLGGFSVKETTQLKLTMLPTSTNMSGPPITYVAGSEIK